MRPVPVTRSALASLAIAVLAACGPTENVQANTDMPAPARDSAQIEAPAPAADEEETGSGRTEIVRTEFNSASRDPFTPPPPNTAPATGSDRIDEIDCDITQEPLGFTEVGSLRLVGLVTGTPVPRAMFSNTDAQGRGIIVAEGAKVGPRCASYISDIRDNAIVVTQRTADEASRVETVIQLTTARVEAEVTSNR
jgi:hypothetical protein